MQESIAVKKFRLIRQSVVDSLELIDKEVSPNPHGGVSAILRGLYCVSVSAVEEYFTSLGVEFATSRLVPAGQSDGNVAEEEEYVAFFRSLKREPPGKKAKGVLKEKGIGRARILFDFNAVSFTSVDRFARVVEYCSRSCSAQKVIERLDDSFIQLYGSGLSAEKRWALVVDRRNMIAHGGDFEQGVLRMRSITSDDVRYVSRLSEIIVEVSENATVESP